MPTIKELKELVKKELGLDVKIESASPVCVNYIGLECFGLTSTLYIYRYENGELHAIMVPFGLSHKIKAA